MVIPKNFGAEIISLTDLELAESIASPANCDVRRAVYSGEQVAVKLLKTDDAVVRGSLVTELGIWSSLNDPNVVKLIGATEAVFCPAAPFQDCCIVAEYMAYGSLDGYLKRNCLSLSLFQHIAKTAARGLVYLHSRDVIHRDVKLANYLLDQNFCAKVADFGFSEVKSKPMGGIVSSPPYTAPECYSGQYGTFSDVYSFGVVLERLYRDGVAADRAYNDNKGRPCPKELKDLIRLCMEKETGKRPVMTQVLEVLEHMDLTKEPPRRRTGLMACFFCSD